MTKQEIFDKVVRGLASQGWRQSVAPGVGIYGLPVCAYRGADGLKCAIGYLIEDDDYDPCFENRSVDLFPDPQLEQLLGLPIDMDLRQFLFSVQRVHDVTETPTDRKARYLEYGAQNCLIWPSDVPKEGPL